LKRGKRCRDTLRRTSRRTRGAPDMKRVVVLPEESKQLDETIKVLDGAMARGESIKETMRKLGVTMNAGTFAQAAAQTKTASEAKQHELAEAKRKEKEKEEEAEATLAAKRLEVAEAKRKKKEEEEARIAAQNKAMREKLKNTKAATDTGSKKNLAPEVAQSSRALDASPQDLGDTDGEAVWATPKRRSLGQDLDSQQLKVSRSVLRGTRTKSRRLPLPSVAIAVGCGCHCCQ